MCIPISREFQEITSRAETLASRCKPNQNPTSDDISSIRTSLNDLQGRVTLLNAQQKANSSSGSGLDPASLERINNNFQTVRNFLHAQEFTEVKTPSSDGKGKTPLTERSLPLVGFKISKDLFIQKIFQYLSIQEQVAFCESHRTGITQADQYQALKIRKAYIYEILRGIKRMPYTSWAEFFPSIGNLTEQLFLGHLEKFFKGQARNVGELLIQGKLLFDEEKIKAASLLFLHSLRNDLRLIKNHPLALPTSQSGGVGLISRFMSPLFSQQGITDPENLENLLNDRICDAKVYISQARHFHPRFEPFATFTLTELPQSLVAYDSRETAEQEAGMKAATAEHRRQTGGRFMRSEFPIRLIEIFGDRTVGFVRNCGEHAISLTRDYGDRIVLLTAVTAMDGFQSGMLALSIYQIAREYFR